MGALLWPLFPKQGRSDFVGRIFQDMPQALDSLTQPSALTKMMWNWEYLTILEGEW